MAKARRRVKVKGWTGDGGSALAEAHRENERLKAELHTWQECSARQDHELDDADKRADHAEAELRLKEADYRVLEDKVCDFEARLAKVHLACAAYPIKCPDCGYEWRAGLTGLAALAAAQPEEESHG